MTADPSKYRSPDDEFPIMTIEVPKPRFQIGQLVHLVNSPNKDHTDEISGAMFNPLVILKNGIVTIERAGQWLYLLKDEMGIQPHESFELEAIRVFPIDSIE